MRRFRILSLSSCIALATGSACAQWTPSWIGAWQYEPSPRSVAPTAVRVSDDGRIFTLLDAGHAGQGHAALARFDEGGVFAWLRERAGSFRMDARLMDGNRIAVVDQFGLDVRVRVYDGDGGVAWDDQSQAGLLAAGPRRLAIASDGGLLIPAVDGDDFIVIRYAADGQALPAWRWSPGPEDLQVDDIVATPDGGAVVGGAGDPLTGGLLVVRFDAAGQVVFADRELGDHGTTHGMASLMNVEVDGNGDVMAAGALENATGATQAQLWKIGIDGKREWTRVLANPAGAHLGVTIGGFALADDGDALVATDLGDYGPLRLLRADSGKGETLQVGIAPIDGQPTGLARVPNGRLLVTGFHFIDSQGHIGARIAEFDPDLRPCRVADLDTQYFTVVAAGSSQGWTLAAGSLFEELSNEARVLRFDADGPCDVVDAIFADGFDAAAPGPPGMNGAATEMPRLRPDPALQ
jgi:sugar lactone lactonase YvrE